MAKIYRRDNLVSGVTPKKKNEKNRKRSVIVNFRVTPEEKQLIDERIALSGLPRAEFFIQSCMYQKVITFIVLLWYAIVTTVFAAIRSGIFLGDFTAFCEVLWNGIRQSCKWIVGVAKALAQVGDRIPNEMIAIIVHWLLFIIVIAGVAGVIGVLIVIVEKKVTKAYRENCWDVISVGMAVIGLAVAMYFGDWIKALVKLNLVALLLLVQAVYVGIRVYVKGCKRARGYY